MTFATGALLASAVLSADFGAEVGRIRPELHSSGFGPKVCSITRQTMDEIRSMGFKSARTHDWALVNEGQRVCDYFHIFPLMHLNAEDPKNYYFAPTDYLLKRTREELGLDVFYRLGTSIEHSGNKVHFNSLIPEDFDKVVETFAGTVRHYNRGWANGFDWGIRYWEIWNEPNGANNMWCLPDGDWDGVDLEEKKRKDEVRLKKFTAFFVKALKRLKGEFGESIKVGGPAATSYYVPYLEAVLDACRREGVALDFLSWHGYADDPMRFSREAEHARQLCDSRGFTECELIINEWHYFGKSYTWDDMQRCSDPAVKARIWNGPDGHCGIRSACFNLATLANLQRSKLDQAYYYGCGFGGSWSYKDIHHNKFKVYYSLKLFGDMVKKYPIICESVSAGACTVFAVKNEFGEKALLVVDYGGQESDLEVAVKGLSPSARAKCRVLDYLHDLSEHPVRLEDGTVKLRKNDHFCAAYLVELADNDAVRLSDFGWDAADATAIVQKALDSGARKIVVDRRESPWICDRLKGRGDVELVFEEDAEIQAKAGCFLGKRDALLTFANCTNVVIRGEGRGGVIRMRRADYDKPPYAHAEWRHTLQFLSCVGVDVRNMRVLESGGDGAYISTDYGRKDAGPCRDVTFRNCVFDRHYRQGISVISAVNLLIEDCVLSNTKGAAPQAGIDFEPNTPDEKMENIVLRRCRSVGNAGNGYEWHFSPLRDTSSPVSMVLEDCSSEGCANAVSMGLLCQRLGTAVGGKIEVKRCVFRAPKLAGLQVFGKPKDGAEVVFEDCTVENAGCNWLKADVALWNQQPLQKPNDGIAFKNLRIVQSGKKHDWFVYARRPFFETTPADIRGDVTVVDPEGCEKKVVLDDAWRAVNLKSRGVVAACAQGEAMWGTFALPEGKGNLKASGKGWRIYPETNTAYVATFEVKSGTTTSLMMAGGDSYAHAKVVDPKGCVAVETDLDPEWKVVNFSSDRAIGGTWRIEVSPKKGRKYWFQKFELVSAK